MKIINTIIGHMNKLPGRTVLILSYGLVLLFGSIDLLTQHRIVFGVLFLLPVILASWFGDQRQGNIISFLSVGMLFLNDLQSHRREITSLLLYWDAVGRLLPFLVIAYALPALRNAFRKERELARTDPLTGIANSRAFYELANREINRAKRYGYAITAAYMDIDNFKAVNDTLGHAAGDRLLKTVAKMLHGSIRTIDIVARVGGDEFALMLPKTGYEESQSILQRIHDTLDEEMKRNELPVTLSLGAVTYRNAMHTIDEIIRTSDRIMYRVKSSGKNNILHETK